MTPALGLKVRLQQRFGELLQLDPRLAFTSTTSPGSRTRRR
ncbi:hypothetical protein [Streptomyces cucumeris]